MSGEETTESYSGPCYGGPAHNVTFECSIPMLFLPVAEPMRWKADPETGQPQISRHRYDWNRALQQWIYQGVQS